MNTDYQLNHLFGFLLHLPSLISSITLWWAITKSRQIASELNWLPLVPCHCRLDTSLFYFPGFSLPWNLCQSWPFTPTHYIVVHYCKRALISAASFPHWPVPLWCTAASGDQDFLPLHWIEEAHSFTFLITYTNLTFHCCLHIPATCS